MITTALAILLIVTAIGVVVGIGFSRIGRGGWLGRKIGGNEITGALVGIAGAFIGFHVGIVLGLLPSPLMYYIAAVIGAVVVSWAWRGRS